MDIKAMIDESYEIEREAGKIQIGRKVGLPKEGIEALRHKYKSWYGRSLVALADDLKIRFQSEYECGWVPFKIKDFLNDPTKKYVGFHSDYTRTSSVWQHPFEDFRKHLTAQRHLLIEAEEREPVQSEPDASVTVPPRVFLVHGHNERYIHECARLLEQMHLEPVVLREEPNRGRTIIEKFEEHSEVQFAVVLLTADDHGGKISPTEKDLLPRARQNVILEFGYFLARLGRSRVCVLCENGVDLPSDVSAMLNIKLDDDGSWRYRLANELRDSGLPVDMNDVRR